MLARKGSGDDRYPRSKRATVAFYLDQIVPEALGLEDAASASAEGLYAIATEDLAA